MAADHERLDVIDQLLQAGTPIDAVDPWGRQALRLAAGNGRGRQRPAAARPRADPNQRDDRNLIALEWCRICRLPA